MYEHFKNMQYLYGDDMYVQMPNDIFGKLSSCIKNKNGSTNIQQSSFAYVYLVIVSFLYKYAHFVDIDNGTYIQNADIKEILGYSKTTKSIDHVIKKGGILDEVGLTNTIKDYPIRFTKHPHESINNIPVIEYVTIGDLSTDDINYDIIKKIVKNRNYEVKEPTFLFDYNDDVGTLYNYSNTHKVTIREIIKFIEDKDLDNIDLSMYLFFKSKCQGEKSKCKSISLSIITYELGLGKDSFYSHLDKLKQNKLIEVIHKGWVMSSSEQELDSNEYFFKRI